MTVKMYNIGRYSLCHEWGYVHQIEKEHNNKINFLDITVHRLHSKLEYKIYRKSTSTSTIIHSTSCHPGEHKTMAFNILFNRLVMYHLNKRSKNLEAKIIKQIAQENNYLSNNTAHRKNKKTKDLLQGQYTILLTFS
jgi:hypothetical protein